MLYNGITHRADSGVALAVYTQLQCAMHRITTPRPLQTKQTVRRREAIKSSPLLLRVLHLFTRLSRLNVRAICRCSNLSNNAGGFYVGVSCSLIEYDW